MQRNQIIEIKSDVGAGIKGAKKGVDILENVFLKLNKHLEKIVVKSTILGEISNDLPYAKGIGQILEVCNKSAIVVKESIKSGNQPIILLGDHSSSIGTISGVCAAYPGKKVGVIWIDAHTDIHSPYTTPSGNMHGMPLAALLNEDNKEKAVNALDKETIDKWESLKLIASICPKIASDQLVFVGVRSFEEPEAFLLKKKNIKNFTVEECLKNDASLISKECLDLLRHCEWIHISFDIDSLDAKLVPGTGTPVANGLSKEFILKLLKVLLNNPKISSFEITELNPELDQNNKTTQIVSEILTSVFEDRA